MKLQKKNIIYSKYSQISHKIRRKYDFTYELLNEPVDILMRTSVETKVIERALLELFSLLEKHQSLATLSSNQWWPSHLCEAKYIATSDVAFQAN